MSSVGPLEVSNVLEGYRLTSTMKHRDVAVVEVNGKTLVYLNGATDGGTPIFELDADGQFNALGDASEGMPNEDGLSTLATYKGKNFLLMADPSSHWVASYRIVKSGDHAGELRFGDLVGNKDSYDFEYVQEVVPFKIEGSPYFAVTGRETLSVFALEYDGDMTFAASVDYSEVPELEQIVGVTALQIGDQTLLFARWVKGDPSLNPSSGIVSFTVDADGAPGLLSKMEIPGRSDLYSLSVLSVGGTDYLVGYDSRNDRFLVYQSDATGVLSDVSSLDLDSGFFGLGAVEVIELDGIQMLAVIDQDDNALRLYGIDADGTLSLAQELVDETFGEAADGLTFAEVDGHSFLLSDGGDWPHEDIAMFSMEIGGGKDLLKGAAGDDVLLGLAGNDRLVGLGGKDLLKGGIGRDVLKGGAGADDLWGGNWADRLFGGNGADLLQGGVGADLMVGGNGKDTASYAGSSAAVEVNLSTGLGTGGDAQGDVLRTIENLIGSTYKDVLVGDNGANSLEGGRGKDQLEGKGGNDRLEGGGGNDQLLGGTGDDTLLAGAGRDRLEGGAGDDVLIAGKEDGFEGGDLLLGGAGDDIIISGSGFDVAKGGAGSDTFVFDDDSLDLKIRDFTLGEDKVDFSDFGSLNRFKQVTKVLEDSYDGAFILAEGKMIKFMGVEATDLASDDFLF
ncbi:MAG: calcium-binding protein [Pseudodonghicola sp.]|nr:calcium-binding protein [Pseudodonghicola sp.]